MQTNRRKSALPPPVPPPRGHLGGGAHHSFYPAAKKVVSHPIIKWGLGVAFSALVTVLTTGVYPLFRGWALTRASTDQVGELEARVGELEGLLAVDPVKLNYALGDSTTNLTPGEQLEWVLLRHKRLQIEFTREVRSRVGMEAQLRFVRPDRKEARLAAARVRAEFDSIVLKGEKPEQAAARALESILGR